MIDWKRKLTSRKFWTSVASFASMLLIYFGAAESDASKVAALIMAGASVIGYVIGEGLADGGNNSTTTTNNYTVADKKKDGES